MLGWSRKLWILISLINWLINLISPSKIIFFIFLRAQIKLVSLCLAKYTAPNCPSYKYLRISKSSILIVFLWVIGLPMLLISKDWLLINLIFYRVLSNAGDDVVVEVVILSPSPFSSSWLFDAPFRITKW